MAMRRRLHPHSPCASFGRTSHRNIFGDGTRGHPMLYEAWVIEAVAARHIVGVLLGDA